MPNNNLENLLEDLYKNIPTPDDRYENGPPHHPRSIKLYEHISFIDFHYNNDRLYLTCGGAGDLGEDLLSILDMILEANNGEYP